MDSETAETVAGAVRLVRRAAALAWAVADGEGARSPRQGMALGIDVAGGELVNLLPAGLDTAGPEPIGEDPASLLRSAEQLLRTLHDDLPVGLPRLRAQIADLAWEVTDGAGA